MGVPIRMVVSMGILGGDSVNDNSIHYNLCATTGSIGMRRFCQLCMLQLMSS
jgi:hypothetical protein